MVKSFMYEEEEEKMSTTDHKTLMNFKNFVIRRLITTRSKKLPNMSEMLVKLKAMVAADEAGN